MKWVIGILALCLVVTAVADEPQQAIVDQVTQWLALVDEQKYDRSWSDASPMLQESVDQATWADTLGKVRKPMGSIGKRTLAIAERKTELPGTPAGDYLIMQFRTDFENGTMIETVVARRSAEQGWLVAGYFLKPEAAQGAVSP